jgi:beta-glucosidase
VPYAQIPYSVNDSPEHDRLSRRMAQESIVLLKNTGVLPLRKDLGTLAVIGPNADELQTLLGNYFGTPSHPVTALAGIRAAVSPRTKVVYARGADLVEGRQDPRAVPVIDSAYLRPEAGSSQPGLKGEYFKGRELQGAPVLTRVDAKVDFRWDRGAPTDDLVARGELAAEQALGPDDYSARWTGRLVPPVSGRYEISVAADDGFRLFIDGAPVLEDWNTNSRVKAKSTFVDLVAGKGHEIRLEYFEAVRDAEVHLGWRLPGAKPPFDEALDAARAADAVVFVGGLTADVEGEEMKVPYPGFAGGDRTDLALPASQQKLLEALQATGKPVVFVLMTGSALAVNWAEQHLPAIVLAWYPGQEGGNAIADVLFGDVNPAGRLPVTFYKSVGQLPPFASYDMEGRTYRYFRGEALYPFGYGRSYTRFEYSGLRLDKPRLGATDSLEVTVLVKNAGDRDGDEVVQLYVRAPESRLKMPLRELRGFERVSLKRGEAQTVRFRLSPARDFAHYDVDKKAFAVEPGAFEVQVGASSQDIRLTGRVRVDP